MPRGRGAKFSAYVGDKSPEERAFWDAAEQFRYPDDDSRAGRIHWAAFMAYLAKLVQEDRRRQTPIDRPAIPDPVRLDVNVLRERVDRLEQLIQRGEFVARTPEAEALQENLLAEKAQKMRTQEW